MVQFYSIYACMDVVCARATVCICGKLCRVIQVCLSDIQYTLYECVCKRCDQLRCVMQHKR